MPYESYKRKRPKHEPTDSYFYLVRQLAEFMMIADALNLHVYPVITEMTATKQIPTLHVCYMTCSSPRCLVRSHSLVCRENPFSIVGIGPIPVKEL